MTRDCAAEMRAVIDAATSNGPYVPPMVAEEIVAKLRATDRALLDGWLQANAVQFVREAINHRDRVRRAVDHQRAASTAFATAAEQHANGNSSTLRRFLDAPYTVEDGSRRPLASLRKSDLLFVAEDYRRRASENAFKAKFMAALAKKVGAGTVGDHFTEDQLAAMWAPLGGQAAA